MDTRFIYTDESGRVCVECVAYTDDEKLMTKRLNRVKERLAGTNFKEISVDEIPADRYFRNAWELDGDKIVVSVSKAKDIQKDVLRALRQPRLQALDVEYLRAQESGDIEKLNHITKKKKELRDITTLEMPDDLDSIKKFIPEVLKD